MTKRISTLAVFVAAVGFLLPAGVLANTITGRVTNFSPASISVFYREVVTVGIDNQTSFSKLITQKPWQEDTSLTAKALRVGGYVVVHVPENNGGVANWVQVATGVRPVAGVAAPLQAFAAPQSGGSAPATSKAKASDLLTSKQVKALIATAKTPAEHVKLQKHFLALAAKYEADATEHAAEAQEYRKNPGFRDSKNPVGPGTAAHCDRFAELDREAAKEARDLASAHEHMAAAH